jgi:hypothetical protein
MNFLEYVVMFDKIKRDNTLLFMVGENSFQEYKIGDIVIVDNSNYMDVDDNVFVVIESNNISIPINYLFYISNGYKNIEYVYQLDEKKIIEKIGKVNLNIISDYKKKYILLNSNIKSEE